jgi:hypothetical protein
MICGRVDGVVVPVVLVFVLDAAEVALLLVQVVVGVVAEVVVTGGVMSMESSLLLVSMGMAAVEGGVNKSRLLLAWGLLEEDVGCCWCEEEEVAEDCL